MGLWIELETAPDVQERRPMPRTRTERGEDGDAGNKRRGGSSGCSLGVVARDIVVV